MQKLYEFGVGVARRMANVPDDVSDEDAIKAGFITPEMIEAIVVLITMLLNGCLANNRQQAWRRVRMYAESKKASDRLGDNVRITTAIGRTLTDLAIPREPGDVKAIRDALTTEATELKQEDFNTIHTEALFLTI